MAKKDKIKKHLEKYGSITGLQALSLYGVYRLSSVINRFRNSGMNIRTEMVEYNGTKYAKYILDK